MAEPTKAELAGDLNKRVRDVEIAAAEARGELRGATGMLKWWLAIFTPIASAFIGGLIVYVVDIKSTLPAVLVKVQSVEDGIARIEKTIDGKESSRAERKTIHAPMTVSKNLKRSDEKSLEFEWKLDPPLRPGSKTDAYVSLDEYYFPGGTIFKYPYQLSAKVSEDGKVCHIRMASSEAVAIKKILDDLPDSRPFPMIITLTEQ